MKDLYEKNADFRQYVDAYAKKYVEGRSISVEEALTHQLVKEAGGYYAEKQRLSGTGSTYTPVGECM